MATQSLVSTDYDKIHGGFTFQEIYTAIRAALSKLDLGKLTPADGNTLISSHNGNTSAHNDIRTLIQALTGTESGHYSEHNSDITALNNALTALDAVVNTLKGGYHNVGTISQTNAALAAMTEANRKTALNGAVGAMVVDGDVITDSDSHEWQWNAAKAKWIDTGVYVNPRAGESIFGIVRGLSLIHI